MKLVASVTMTGLSLATTMIVALSRPQAMPVSTAAGTRTASGKPCSARRTVTRLARIRQLGWLRSRKPPEIAMIAWPMARTPTIDMVKATARTVWCDRKSGRQAPVAAMSSNQTPRSAAAVPQPAKERRRA